MPNTCLSPVDYHSPLEVVITGRVLKVVVITSVTPLPVWTAPWERNVDGWSAGAYAEDAKEAGARPAHACEGDNVVEIVEDRLALKFLIRLEPPASEEVLRIVVRILVTDQFNSCRQRQPGKFKQIQDPERRRTTSALHAS
jgi:hypothetical protein